MRKTWERVLAFVLCVSLLIGLAPTGLLAAEAPPQAKAAAGENWQVSTAYDSTGRNTATVTYHREPTPAEPVNFIFLVDLASTGGTVYRDFIDMMRASGNGYIYNYGEKSDTKVRMVGYQDTVLRDTKFLQAKSSCLEVFELGKGTPGNGVANEPLALETVTQMVKDQQAVNDYPTVVFWALGEKMEQPAENVEPALQGLKNALGDDGALITWQYADEPMAMLEKYASTFTVPHEAGSPSHSAAFADKNAEVFKSGMSDSIEKIMDDQYHDVHIPLRLADGQTLVEKITKVDWEAGSPEATLDYTITDDGKGVDIRMDQMGRQYPVDITLTLELNPDVHEKQTVLAEQTLSLADSGGKNGVHSGVFDDQSTPVAMTWLAVELDRTQYNLSYRTSAEGETVSLGDFMQGEVVRIPTGDEIAQESREAGKNFGGWNVVVGGDGVNKHFNGGEMIQMPENAMVLEATWGQLEVELEIAKTSGGAEAGNTLRDGPGVAQRDEVFNFSKYTDIDGEKIGSNVVSITFKDEQVPYDTWPQEDGDAYRVDLPTIDDVYARHVGATDNDKVVAYLVKSQEQPGKYDMIVTGPGGVTASQSLNQMFSNRICPGLERINFNDCFYTQNTKTWTGLFKDQKALTLVEGMNLDTTSATAMSNMFRGCSSLETLDLTGFHAHGSLGYFFYGCEKLSNLTLDPAFINNTVTSMGWMFEQCKALTALDLSAADTSNVTDMSSMLKDCEALESLILGEGFTTGNVTDMGFMFQNCKKLDTSQLVTNWDVSKVEDFNNMFRNNLAVTSFDLSNWSSAGILTGTSGMFAGCANVQSIVWGQNLDTSKVTNMSSMFAMEDEEGAAPMALETIDFGDSFKTDSVKSFTEMFRGCQNLTNLDALAGWNVGNGTTFERMFKDCTSLQKLELGNWQTDQVNNVREMFQNVASATTITLPQFTFAGAVDLSGFAEDCKKVEALDFSGWNNVSKITSMASLCAGNSNLQSVTFGENWTKEPLGVDTLESAFNACTSLESIDLSGWDVQNLSNVSFMFNNDGNLKNVNLAWKNAVSTNPNVRAAFQQTTSDLTVTVSDETGAVDPKSEAFLRTMLSQKEGNNSQFEGKVIPEDFLSGGTADEPQAPEESLPPDAGDAGSSEEPLPPEESGEGAGDVLLPADSSEDADAVTPPEDASELPPDNGADIDALAMAAAEAAPLADNVLENPKLIPVGDSMMVVEPETPPETQVTYRVTVKYTGDVGAKSGTIDMAYPLPEHMVYDASVKIERSEIKNTGGDTGYFGGRVVTEPYLDMSSSAPVLRATFEGLYTGTEIEVTVTGVNKEHSFNDDGYMFWDGTAYAKDGASSAASKTVRLWYSKAEEPMPEDPEYRVSYEFRGDLPENAEMLLPDSEMHKENDTVTVAEKPSVEGYEFTGWERVDKRKNSVNSGDSFSMPANDVLLIGTFKAKSPKEMQVEYRYDEQSPKPDDAPEIGEDGVIRSPQVHRVGEVHNVANIYAAYPGYTFAGWTPTLEIKGTTYEATSHDGTQYVFNVNGKDLVLDMDGNVIQTDVFADLATDKAEETKVILTGTWTPAKGIIHFDGNGATEVAMADMTDVTPDDSRNLTKNTFKRDGYTFTGWALYPAGGNKIWQDEAPAAGFITEDKQEVTLFAQWSAKPAAEDYVIEVQVDGGKAQPGGTHDFITVKAGDDQAFTFEPDDKDYKLESVTVDGQPTTFNNGDNGYIFRNVMADHKIHVVYTKEDVTPPPSGGDEYRLHYESNGGTEYKDEWYSPNTVVTLDKMPTREGYTFTGWYADKELAEKIDSVKMTSNKTVYAGWKETDVPDWLNGRDHLSYIAGYEDGTVRPKRNITRAEVASMFYRLLEDEVREQYTTTESPFTDVSPDAWYGTSVATMANAGIIKGRTPDSFAPDAPITRAEFAAIASRFDTSDIEAGSDFTDISGHWAEHAIERAATIGWIVGYEDGTFRPENQITRAEAMTLVNRVLKRLPENDSDLLDEMKHWPDNAPGSWYYLAVQEATNSHDFERKDDGVHESWTQLRDDTDIV